MATWKPSGTISDGPNASAETGDFEAVMNLAAAGTLAVGQVVSRDVTQFVGQYSIVNNPPAAVFTASADQVVLPTSANAGDVYGVYQGPGYNNALYTNSTGATLAYGSGSYRKYGPGRVLAGAVTAGTAVTVGSTLIVTATNAFATVGVRAIGTSVGRVIAYPINTTINAAIAAGAGIVVTPVSMAGINVNSSLTIDSGSNQEVVVVTAVTATTFTATFAKAHGTFSGVQGLTSAQGASIIAVPGSGNLQAVVIVDINVLA